jgi:hypothetical protein
MDELKGYKLTEKVFGPLTLQLYIKENVIELMNKFVLAPDYISILIDIIMKVNSLLNGTMKVYFFGMNDSLMLNIKQCGNIYELKHQFKIDLKDDVIHKICSDVYGFDGELLLKLFGTEFLMNLGKASIKYLWTGRERDLLVKYGLSEGMYSVIKPYDSEFYREVENTKNVFQCVKKIGVNQYQFIIKKVSLSKTEYLVSKPIDDLEYFNNLKGK